MVPTRFQGTEKSDLSPGHHVLGNNPVTYIPRHPAFWENLPPPPVSVGGSLSYPLFKDRQGRIASVKYRKIHRMQSIHRLSMFIDLSEHYILGARMLLDATSSSWHYY